MDEDLQRHVVLAASNFSSSRSDSSRASTARSTPSSRANSTPSGEVIVICVLACIGSSGVDRPREPHQPDVLHDQRIDARAAASRSIRSAASSSPVKMSVLNATYAFTPCRWQNLDHGSSSSGNCPRAAAH